MKNSNFYIIGIFLIILFFAFYLLFYRPYIDFSPAPNSAYGDKGICTDESFPAGSTKCGGTCCYKGDSCFKGEKCCPPGSDGEEVLGVFFCDKKCNKKTQVNCGNTCCDRKTEQCKTTGEDNIGFCLPFKEHKCTPGTTPCPANAGSWDKTSNCCGVNQECLDKSTTVDTFLGSYKVSIFVCSANSCKDGESLCEGRESFVDYKICCGKCASHPDGEPYCAPYVPIPIQTGGPIEPVRDI